jgi:hypothetical protein
MRDAGRRLVRILPLMAGLCCVSICLSAEPPGLPDGSGKATVLKRCSKFHPPELLLDRLDTPKNWTRKVDSMINRGAELTPDEVAEVTAYLNTNFALTPERVRLPDGQGKAELKRVCGSCHPAEVVANRDSQAGLRNQWLDTIDRMLGHGAKGTPEELELITDYLVANFAYIPVRTYLPNGRASKRQSGFAVPVTARPCWPTVAEGALRGAARLTTWWAEAPLPPSPTSRRSWIICPPTFPPRRPQIDFLRFGTTKKQGSLWIS